MDVHPRRGAMLTWPVPAAGAILGAMDRTSRLLVVLGLAAGAVAGGWAVAAVLVVAGMDAHGIAAQLLLAVGAVGGAVVGARVNRDSGRALADERAADIAWRASL